MNKAVIAIVLASAAAGAVAAPAPATPAPAASTAAAPIPKQTHDDAMVLLQLIFNSKTNDFTNSFTTGYLNGLMKKHPEITPATADELRQAITKIVNDPDRMQKLEEDLVPLYASVYTDDELRQLIVFGKTSAGAKLLSGTPNKDQIIAALRPWFITDLFPPIYLQTADILKKQGITLENGN